MHVIKSDFHSQFYPWMNVDVPLFSNLYIKTLFCHNLDRHENEKQQQESSILPNVKLKHSSAKKKKVNLFHLVVWVLKSRPEQSLMNRKMYQLLKKKKLNLSKGPYSG